MTSISAFVGLVRTPPQNGLSGWRLMAIALAIVLLAGGMIVRLVSLQVLHPERFVEHGESQRIRSVTLPGERGAIYDRNEIELVVSSPRQSIWVDPRLIEPAEREAVAAEILRLAGDNAEGDLELLTRRMNQDGKKFAWMARQLDDETAAAVLALGLPGVSTLEEEARITPSGGAVARAIVGRTDIDGNGISGLEKQYDELLKGETGRAVVERGLVRADEQRLTIPGGRYELTAPERGSSLILTLDRTVQFEVENLLADHVARAEAESGTVIVSRPRTGEILAMATVVRGADSIVRISGENRAVTTVIEPGSISKPLVMAALFEEGLATPDTQVEVIDELVRYDRVYTDSVRSDAPLLTAAQVLESSSNIGTILLSDRLGDELTHRYLGAFGIGRSTALDFPGESDGILKGVEDWSGTDRSSAAIGYSYAATPLQMLRAYNVFANGGVLIEPQLVKEVVEENGERTRPGVQSGERVVAEQTAATVTTLLAGVVRNGTGYNASVTGYEVAGKTATARKLQENGLYEGPEGEVEWVTSFAGYLPASNPELSIIVVIDNPAEESSGGRLAAPLFSEISNFALQHFRIPPADAVLEGVAG